MSEQKPARYDAFINKAERLVRSPARLQRLAGQATRKLAAQGEDGLREAQDQFETALALVKAWASGEYRDVHTRTIVAVVVPTICHLSRCQQQHAGRGFLTWTTSPGSEWSETLTCWSTGRYSCCTLLAPEKTGMRARVFSARTAPPLLQALGVLPGLSTVAPGGR